MNILFAPAIGLSNRLKFSGKFMLLALLFVLQILYVGWTTVTHMLVQRDYAENELLGAQKLLSFIPLMEQVQQRRGLSYRRDNGEPLLDDKLADKTQQIEQLLQQLSHTHSTTELETRWQQLKSSSAHKDDLFEQHSHLVALILDTLSDIAGASGLLLDPEASTFYPMDELVKGLPEYLESLGQIRGYSSGIANGSFAPNSYLQLTVLDKKLLSGIEHINKDFQRIYQFNPEAQHQLSSDVEQLLQQSQKLHNLVKTELLDAETIKIDPKILFKLATDTLNQGFELHKKLAATLKDSIEHRITNEKQTGYLRIITTSLLALFLCYFLYGIYLAIQSGIKQLAEAADTAAQGDLNQQLKLHGQDELTTIAERFNLMLMSIKQLLLEARQTSEDVNDTAADLTRIAQQSEAYLQDQQTESTQVATAITQMSSTVNEVASNAEEAARAADDANRQARQGQQVVKESIASIEQLAQQLDNASEVIGQLEQDSEAIGTVLDVIKSIADQTNLLALNAAIEAARAGEQGRGFAVVADEVRTLASRTQKSTQEIREMIERLQTGAGKSVQAMSQGRNQAHEGVQKSTQAGQALEGITRSVLRIVDMNNQIASAAEEQSVVAEQINQNIVKIAESTSRTLSSGRQVTQASTELGRQATALLSNVNRFRLN